MKKIIPIILSVLLTVCILINVSLLYTIILANQDKKQLKEEISKLENSDDKELINQLKKSVTESGLQNIENFKAKEAFNRKYCTVLRSYMDTIDNVTSYLKEIKASSSTIEGVYKETRQILSDEYLELDCKDYLEDLN